MYRKPSYLIGTVLLLSTVAVLAAITLIGFPRLMAAGLTERDPFAENNIALAQSPGTVEDTDLAEPLALEIPTNTPTEIATNTAEAVSSDPIAEGDSTPVEALATLTPAPTATGMPATRVEFLLRAEGSTISNEAGAITEVFEADPIRVKAVEKAWFYSSLSGEDRWLGWYLAPEYTGEVIGRTPNGEWLLVEADDGGILGWTSAEMVDLISGSLRNVKLSSYAAVAWSDQENPFADAGAQINAAAVAQLPVATPWASTVNKSLPSTPWPTKTPWPTRTKEAPSAYPTNTPRPSAGASVSQPVATATSAWSPSPTAQPLPTAVPSATPTPAPTATSRPQATATTASSPEAAPTQPKPLSESNAIAWWHLKDGSVQTGSGGWQAILVVRVPTSFTYKFEMEGLTRSARTISNDDGDDYYELTLSGVNCGSAYLAEMVAYQNGARMIVQNEFTLEVGTVYINAPC